MDEKFHIFREIPAETKTPAMVCMAGVMAEPDDNLNFGRGNNDEQKT